MEDKLFIDKLSGPENWATWKFQMEHLLKAKGLWRMITEEDTLPADANAAAQNEFTKRREKAFSMVVLNVSTPQLYLITSCQTPKEAWTTLKGHFERDTLANKLFLKKKYFRCEMKEGNSLTEHLKQMKELTDQLAAIGAVIEEEDQIVTLLGSLPPSYATIVTALETKIDNLSLKFVQQALINEEQKRVNATDNSGTTSGGAAAMSSQLRGNVQDGSKAVGAGQSTWRCYKCGKEGHIKRDCPSLKNKPKKKTHKAKNVMLEDEDASSESAFVARGEGSDKPQQVEWLIDSGASKHMTCDQEILQEYQQFSKAQSVKLGDGRVVDALGIGNVNMKMTFKSSNVKDVTMYDVLYVPKLSGNLFSVGAATKKGNTVQFKRSRCYIRGKDGTLKGMGTQRADGLYQLDVEGSESVFHSASVAASLWHQRLGHTTKLKELKGLVNGVDFSAEKEVPFCEGCVEGKLAKKPFKSIGEIRSERKMQLIHSDVCGPMQTESISGAKYFVTFIDDYSRCCKVYFMKQKNEVLCKFKEFEKIFTNECGLNVSRLRTDNGGEYTSKEFQEYLKAQGIHHEMTVPHSPQQNGVAERKNRTLVEAARSMLSHAKLPKMFWAEAVATAAYIQNRLPTSVLKGETPYQRWCGKKPDVSHMKVFGCIAYAHVPDEERRKLDKKAVKLRFVGYANNAKGYRLYDEEKRRILIRRDVVFDESNFNWKQEVKVPCTENEITMKTDESETRDDEVTVESTVRTSGRIRNAPRRFGYDEYADVVTVDHYANMCRVTEPLSLKEAMESPNAKDWQEAADLEYESLLENETWDLVDLPRDRKAVGSRWVFKVKHHSDGRVERYKCRLVAKGYSQLYGADYDETFSPVVRFSSIRTLLSFAVQNNLHVHQMDVVTAFLNGHLEEEIYMEQPEGYVKPGQEHLVCKLKRSIYGLKQSPRCWSKAFTEFMMGIGFKQSTSDPCVFVRSRQELEILAVYVDDLILITESTESMNELKAALKERYKMKDMGELSYILGISVIQDKEKNRVILHQKHYIEAILRKYGMDNANPVATPADANVKLKKSDGVSKPVHQHTYQSMVGSLLYAAMATRPDIAQAVSAVSKFNANPDASHLTAVKRILRYLKGTVNIALKYEKSVSGALIGYSDADWAGDQDDRRSTTGNIFLLSGGAVSWLSKKQATVALSTAEAEYIALSQAAQEGIWLKRLLCDLGVESMPTVILEDNQGAIAIAKNPVNHSRTKHIDIRYHYIRECVQNGQIELQYCPTNDMKADIFTKPLARPQFEYLRGEIGLFPI